MVVAVTKDCLVGVSRYLGAAQTIVVLFEILLSP